VFFCQLIEVTLLSHTVFGLSLRCLLLFRWCYSAIYFRYVFQMLFQVLLNTNSFWFVVTGISLQREDKEPSDRTQSDVSDFSRLIIFVVPSSNRSYGTLSFLQNDNHTLLILLKNNTLATACHGTFVPILAMNL
jgi:hypothetical protein